MNKEIKEMLAGVYAPMVTPFKDDDILFDGIVHNVEKMNHTELKGYFVCGTNGEFKSLSVDERFKVMETVVEHAAENKVVMGGTAAESTKETIEITRRAADIGVQLVSLLVPCFFKKLIDDRVLVSYILDVADVSSVPVLIYNNPSVTGGVLVSPEVIREVSKHPNVIGMKDSSRGNFMSYLEASAEEDFYVMAGSASFFYDLLKAGGIGGVLSLANVIPDKCAELYNLFHKGEVQEVEKLNESIVELNKQVSGKYSVAGVKAAMDIAGYIGGVPRKPLFPVTKSQIKEIREAIENSGLLK